MMARTGNALINTRSIGNTNTAVGASALVSNTTGSSNTAVGVDSFANNTTGTNNTAVGGSALDENTTGNNNTAIGIAALSHSTTGNDNTAIGAFTGSSLTTANNVICIGSGVAAANVSNTCFIGNIRGVTTTNNDATPVLIDSAGQLGTASSSRRYKTDIKLMDRVSETILALKPVIFRYKIHNDTKPQFGLIAEDVADVNPDLVTYDTSGKPYAVRYDAVNAMLLNEFLKEHRKVEEQDCKLQAQRATITELKKEISSLAMTVKKQTSEMQKVRAQLAFSQSAPQRVLNNQ